MYHGVILGFAEISLRIYYFDIEKTYIIIYYQLRIIYFIISHRVNFFLIEHILFVLFYCILLFYMYIVDCLCCGKHTHTHTQKTTNKIKCCKIACE